MSPKSAVGLGALEINSARSPRLSSRSIEKTARSDGTSLADLQVNAIHGIGPDWDPDNAHYITLISLP